MELIVIFGPAAVGKATVGRTLADKIGYKLFHNHMVIEMVHNLFDFGEGPFWELVGEFRRRIFQALKEASGSPDFASPSEEDLSHPSQAIPGVVFTYVWALDSESDYQELCTYFAQLGVDPGSVKYVELEADQSVRLIRNRSESRLLEKKTKRNISQSEGFLLQSARDYRLNTNEENPFPYPGEHHKINNTDLSPEEATDQIINLLGLKSLPFSSKNTSNPT